MTNDDDATARSRKSSTVLHSVPYGTKALKAAGGNPGFLVNSRSIGSQTPAKSFLFFTREKLTSQLQKHQSIKQQPHQNTTMSAQSELAKGKRIPSWAKDPLTGKLMSQPVQFNSKCKHTIDRRTYDKFMEKVHSVDTVQLDHNHGPSCPVCHAPIKNYQVTNNFELEDRIDDLISKLCDIDQAKALEDQSSSTTETHELNGMASLESLNSTLSAVSAQLMGGVEGGAKKGKRGWKKLVKSIKKKVIT